MPALSISIILGSLKSLTFSMIRFQIVGPSHNLNCQLLAVFSLANRCFLPRLFGLLLAPDSFPLSLNAVDCGMKDFVRTLLLDASHMSPQVLVAFPVFQFLSPLRPASHMCRVSVSSSHLCIDLKCPYWRVWDMISWVLLNGHVTYSRKMGELPFHGCQFCLVGSRRQWMGGGERRINFLSFLFPMDTPGHSFVINLAGEVPLLST